MNPSHPDDIITRLYKTRTKDGKAYSIRIRVDVYKLAMSMAGNAIRSTRKTSKARYGVIVVKAIEDETQ